MANVTAWTVSQTLFFFLFTFSIYLCLVKLFCLNDFPLKLELSQMLLIYGFSNCPSSWYQSIHHCRFNFESQHRLLSWSLLHEI